MSQKTSQVNLPRCVTKYELTTYFSCDCRFLWARLVTDELLHGWGYNIDDVKPLRKLDPDLTTRIFVHFQITDLDKDFSKEIADLIAESATRSH